MQSYLIIALYACDHERFAEAYEAETPDEAEDMALEAHPDLIIAGVINEEGQVVA